MGVRSRSTSTPTIPSAWARTARPTSRSRHLALAALHPRTTTSGVPAMRWNRRWRGRPRSNADGPSCLVFSPAEPAAPAARRRARCRHRPRRLRAEGLAAARDHPDRDRSEVALAMDAAKQLGDGVRVVSMPSTDVFDRQDAAYRESVLPKAVRKARRHRSRRDRFLAQVRRAGRRGGRHRPLRRVRANRGADAAFRIHRRAGGGGGEVALIDPFAT